jgi:hypothetical protein
VALVALLGPATPATATTAPCVGVVVDGRLAGGSVRTACATGDPRTGLDALTRAGISYAFVPRQPGQVCQLDGLPACSDTGADTYWSYWWRAKGSSRWVYATSGAGTHDPDPGDTEAWVWQNGGRVEPPDIAFTRICPQAATAHRTRTPTPGASHPATSTGDAVPVPDASTSPKAGSGGLRTRSPTSTAGSRTPASSSTAPTTAAPETSSATSARSPASSATGGAPTASDSGGDGGDGGTPWAGLAVGAVLVGGLGGAAVVRSRRESP